MTELPLSSRPSPRQLVLQLGVASLARMFLNTARRFAYTFAPPLSRGLGVPLTAITSLIAVNQATGLLGPLLGPLADRWGYRVMLLAGLGMLAGGMLAAGLLPLYGLVLLALFLAGLGKTIYDPAVQAYVGQQVPYRRRGLAIGLVEMAWSGSSLVGIPVMGLLIARVGWRAPFVVLGGLGLISLAALAVMLPAPDREARPVRQRAGFGAAWRALGRERAALGALGFSLFLSMGNDSLFVVYAAWLENSFGLGIAALGAATTVIGLAELAGEGLTASLADRLGPKRALVLGSMASMLNYSLLPLMDRTLPLALAGLFLIFLTFEFTIVTGLSLMTEILPGARATMLSTALAGASLGRVIGALLGGLIWLAGGLPAIALATAAITGLALACLVWGLRGWR
ncbi:MAG: MFS transporter [Anaerolineae bacterium]